MGKPKPKYDPKAMQMAVNAVKHAGYTLHEAAKGYCVPYSTLQWRVKNNVEDETCRRGRKPVLSKNKEKTMVEAIVAMKDIGFGLSRKEIIQMAKDVDDRAETSEDRVFDMKGPTGSWFRRFKNRHDLSVRVVENKSVVRYNAECDDIRLDLFEKY